jgi:uncharacterized repeat protein (TIGR01451 family)
MNRLARSLGALLALGLIESTQMLWFPKPTQAQVSTGALCATPGKDGVDLGAINVVNSYFPGPAADNTVTAGSTSIALGAINASGSQTPVSPGDLMLVIQMQDADINYTDTANYGAGNGTGAGSTAINSTGLYEYVVAKSAVGTGGGSLQIQGAGAGGGLLNTYRQEAATVSHGQRTYQVVRVPQYTNTMLSGTIRSPGAWDGKSGGIVAIDIANSFTFANGTVEVQDKGFRGGGGTTNSDTYPPQEDEAYRTDGDLPKGGMKGEGIVGTPLKVFNGINTFDTLVDGYPRLSTEDSYPKVSSTGGSRGRGAPGNAGGGGNQHNSGGGGGGNGGGGGQGGNSINTPPASEISDIGISKPVGGRGGAPFTASVNRLVMGGGGGAGDANNGVAGSGGLGGGIVLIRAGTISGTGLISARARDGVVTPTDDGGSGAGAGGSILINAKSGNLAGITFDASGGKGGDTNTNTTVSYDFGPGGGGGGGVIFSSLPVSNAIVLGGQPGKSFNGQLGTATTGVTRGALPGADGKIAITGTTSSGIPGILSGADCSVNLSGRVWKDTNNSITKDGSEVNTDAGGLYVYLIDANGKVLAKAAVQSDGTYSIFATSSVVPLGTSATLRLSTDGTKNYGQAAPAASLPSGWVNTGENKNGVTETVTPGEIAITSTTNSTPFQDFGINVGVSVQGFKSVKLTKDNDNSATVSPGDELTWTVSYTNTSNTDIANFQVKDVLPTQVSISTGAQVITTNSTQGTAPVKNSSYTGIGNNSTLLASTPPVTLKAGGVITINIPVTVQTGTANNTILQNQSAASGNGLPAQGILSDNVDSATASGALPSGIVVPASSVSQTQNSDSVDPTTVTVSTTSSYIKSPYSGKVIINEVLYRQTAITADGNDEFIELYNVSSSSVDLSGWKLIDGNLIGNSLDGSSGNITGTVSPYLFPSGTTLAPNQYAVIWVGNKTATKQAAGAAFQAWLGTDPKLNDSGEDLWLYDAQTQIVDYMAYGTANAINTIPPATLGLWDATSQASLVSTNKGQSLSLTRNGMDTDTSACWEPTTSTAASSRCINYLPTRDTDAVVISGLGRVTSTGDNNNGLSTNLLLVKRITSINSSSTTQSGLNLATYNEIATYPYDDNAIESNLVSTTQYPRPDTDKWPNTTGNTSSSFLLGAVNGGETKPKDEIEYTIYFLSAGIAPAQDVIICDRIPVNQTFIPNAYNSVPQALGGNQTDRGMAVSYAGNYLSYTNLNDGDTAQYFAPLTLLPTACGATTNATGAVVFNLGTGGTNGSGGTIPQATASGSPTNSYGFVRFKAKVN